MPPDASADAASPAADAANEFAVPVRLPRSLGAVLVAAIILALAGLTAWAALWVVPVTVDGQGSLMAAAPGDSGLSAQVFVPPSAISLIRPGQPVEIGVSTAPRDRYGHMLGRVIEVDAAPATVDVLRAAFGDDHGVSHGVGHGPVHGVRVAIQTDPASPDGLRWVPADRRERPLRSGGLCDGRIEVDRRPLLDLLFGPPTRTAR